MSNVPCNSCTACCRGQLVFLTKEDEVNLAHYEAEAHDVGGAVLRVLRNRPNGECAHLGPNGCSIYEHRPAVCREYDCRKQFRVTTRTQRRQYNSQQVWVEARARLHTLDADDEADIRSYGTRASERSQLFT